MLQEKVDAYLKEKNEEKRERSGKWTPSMFGRCYRAQYWNWKDEPKSNPFDERTLRVFAVGNLFHEFIQDKFDESECEVTIETPNIKGRADLVTPDIVYDIKTCHSQKFWYLEKETKIPITTRERQNFLQVGWYAIQLKKEKCGVVFVSKDDLCMKEYIVASTVCSPWVNAELKVLKEITEKDELPKPKARCYPTYRKGQLQGYKECQYCSWKDKCEEVESGNSTDDDVTDKDAGEMQAGDTGKSGTKS